MTDPSATTAMASIPSVLGGLAFLGASGALVYAGAVAGVVREALRPERRTIGWALARGLPSEPTAWGMPAREWIHAFDGATCPVFEIGEDDPSAPTAVVLHGFARSRYDALSRLEPMLPHARRFLLPDLPGHGDATGRGTRLGWDEDRFVLDLIERHATGPLLLAGHSLGATVAIHAAASEPIAARVRGVLAFAPYERLGTPLGARLHMRGMPRSALVPPALATLGMLGVRERSTRASAVRLHAPLAVLAGESDPVAPCAEARALANAARRARFAVIPNARHDDFHTLGREETTAALAWITHHA